MFSFSFFISFVVEYSSFSEAYNKTPFLFYLALLSFITTYANWKHESKKIKKIVASDKYQNSTAKLESLMDISDQELNNPKDTTTIEIISCQYEITNEKFQAMKIDGSQSFYVNIPKEMYIVDNHLYISDLGKVVEIPLSSIKHIEKVTKTIKTPSPLWSKKVSFKKKPYKKYKIKARKAELVMKSYYTIHIEINNQPYAMMMPLYEIDSFTNLTGITYL